MSNVKEISVADFEKEVLKSDLPVLVDFWAPWCGPCLAMAPVLDEVAQEMEGKMKIVKINVEEAENQELAGKYQIQSIPNMKFFKNGQVVGEFVGMRPKEALISEIESKL
ncbi:MAG: thioredoxin [Patescibacteria group bacterium]